jgi:hypothetical protein
MGQSLEAAPEATADERSAPDNALAREEAVRAAASALDPG